MAVFVARLRRRLRPPAAGLILTLGAGFAYGVAVGIPLVWVSANLGAARRLPARADARSRPHRGPGRRQSEVRRHRSRRRPRGTQDRAAHAAVAGLSVQPPELRLRPHPRRRSATTWSARWSAWSRGRRCTCTSGRSSPAWPSSPPDAPAGGTAKQLFTWLGLAATVAVTVVDHPDRAARARRGDRRPAARGRAGARRRVPSRRRSSCPTTSTTGALLSARAPERARAIRRRAGATTWSSSAAGTAGLVSAAGAAGLGAQGRARRAPSHRRRLPERRLRAVEGADPRGARGGERAPCRPTSASTSARVDVDFAAVMERMRRLRADIAPNDGVERFTDARRRRLSRRRRASPARRPSRSTAARSSSRAPSSPPARAPPRRPSPASTRPATSPTRPSSRSPSCRAAWS